MIFRYQSINHQPDDVAQLGAHIKAQIKATSLAEFVLLCEEAFYEWREHPLGHSTSRFVVDLVKDNRESSEESGLFGSIQRQEEECNTLNECRGRQCTLQVSGECNSQATDIALRRPRRGKIIFKFLGFADDSTSRSRR